VVERISRDFTISGTATVAPNGAVSDRRLFSLFDERYRRGVTLNLIAGGGGYCAQGDAVRISFGIDDGSQPVWADCGAPDPGSRYVSNSLTVLDGSLYAATTDSADPGRRARVFRYRGGAKWDDLGSPADVDAHGIGPMIAHRGSLYVAPWTYDWTVVKTLELSPVHVYRLTADGTWEDCGQPGHCRRIYGFASYQGNLYASGDDDAVHVLGEDGRWSVSCRLPSYAHPMYVHDDRLWVGTVDPGQIWSFDGATWRADGNPQPAADRASQIHAFSVRHGELVVGSWPHGFVDVRHRDSGVWQPLGGPLDATEINALQQFNGVLYAGALPYAEVSRYDGDGRWEPLHRFNARPGWQAASVRSSGWQSRQEMEGAQDDVMHDDRLMRDWGRVTSMVEHDGQLFVSTGNCTSAAADTGGDSQLGHVFAMTAGTVATSAAALAPGEHHVAAVRRGTKLRLYIDGAIAASSDGEIDGEIEFASIGPTGSGLLRDVIWHDAASSDTDVAKLSGR
jgi:hypothetical protein